MFDPVIIIPKLFESMAKEAGSKVLNGIFGSLSKFRDALTMNFSEYLHSAINRTSYVKTLLHRDQSVNLFSIYVERFLQSGSVTIRDDNLIEVICNSAAIMVIGSAGSGKTMLIRHLFLQLVENTHGLMPIFIELRRFNSSLSKDSIIDFIYDTVVRPGAVVTKSQFCDCLRENMFVLILDGLDEVEHDARQEVSDQIANLREAYPNLGIVISSRPDHRLEAWSDFEIYRIQSMRKDQVKALLSKLPWDPEVRTRFIEEVDKHLYAKHENFLSNPLLATMMLMTFDQYANIPDKMHIFYDHAFQTLFDRHDAGKQGWYGRKNYTLLDINQFKNCLSALCIHSYDFKKLLFSEAEILNILVSLSSRRD
jgi:NACHT domain